MRNPRREDRKTEGEGSTAPVLKCELMHTTHNVYVDMELLMTSYLYHHFKPFISNFNATMNKQIYEVVHFFIKNTDTGPKSF